MTRILRSPTKYVQGPAVLRNLKSYLPDYGKKALFFMSEGGIKRLGDDIRTNLDDSEIDSVIVAAKGGVTAKEVERLCGIADAEGVDMIVGVGGGTIIDTAKAAGSARQLPIIIAPTIASTDAPCSALSILYHENGEFDKYVFLKESPNLILVDTDVILKTDPRLLVAGMGDALATYYEARAVQRSGSNNQVAGKPTAAAYTLAEKAKDILYRDGLSAKYAIECGADTPAFQNVVEVNTYMSGIGFESGGLAAAHAIQKGFTHCPELDSVYHGEKVAFCIIVQLVMENAPPEELKQTLSFMKSVGLPTTLEELGMRTISDDILKTIAENSVHEGMTIHNMPFKITAETVFAGLKAANAIGENFQN